jgi:hypothetical protein
VRRQDDATNDPTEDEPTDDQLVDDEPGIEPEPPVAEPVDKTNIEAVCNSRQPITITLTLTINVHLRILDNQKKWINLQISEAKCPTKPKYSSKSLFKIFTP